MATNKKIQEKTQIVQDNPNALVEIELFRDNKDYKDNVFVAVNGESCVIARGRKVKIKKKFADVIENSMRQDVKTARLMDNKSDEFFAEAAARNM
ncbi:MAG: hypothetical protein E7392_02980 [Ruminococcaceae bacterium]|nr:hypothetical protein [Oscillospiraceae bacterium]